MGLPNVPFQREGTEIRRQLGMVWEHGKHQRKVDTDMFFFFSVL